MPTMAQLIPLPPRQLAAVVGLVAEAVANARESDGRPGPLTVDSVTLDDTGMPVIGMDGGTDPNDDVPALGRLLILGLGGDVETGDDPWAALQARLAVRTKRRRDGDRDAAHALARIAVRASDPDPSRRPTARQLAAAIEKAVPDARPPAVAPSRASRLSVSSVAWPAAAIALAAVGLLLLSVAGPAASGGDSRPKRPAISSRTACVCPAGYAFNGGVLTDGTAQWRVGQDGDVVAVADWSCDDSPTAVLLRPATGTVYAFDGWAEVDRPTPGRRLATVPDGVALAVDRQDRCPSLRVETANGARQEVSVG